MNPEQMQEKAEQLYMKRFHWSQSVLAVGQEKLGRGNEEVIRAVGAYGGGLGAGEVCGAVFGPLAVFGLRFSRGKEEEKEDLRVWAYNQEFLKRFREEIGNGSIYCRDIAGVDWTDLKKVKEFYRSEKLLECQRLTGNAARLLGEILDLDHL